jgi:putative transposon-encoded protein
MKKEIIISFEGSEILERTASKFGTGCHVIVPKEYEGKHLKIIFEENKKEAKK